MRACRLAGEPALWSALERALARPRRDGDAPHLLAERPGRRSLWRVALPSGEVLFVKRFPAYPDRVYNEMAALTISLWYYRDVVCELEPIGPMEVLAPGESRSFTEEWWLVPYPFPERRDSVDLRVVDTAQQVMQR